jgi:hypothetical protein
MIKSIIFLLLFAGYSVLLFIAGFWVGVEDTHRDAYENGLMIIDRVGDKRIYRWIETHKIGYDYEY